jgi:hypothetical protein
MRRPSIGPRKDFQASIGQGEQAQGGVRGGLPRMDGCVFFLERKEMKEEECVREDISHMCEGRLFIGKNVCKQEYGRRLCVASSYSGILKRISMNKPLDS